MLFYANSISIYSGFINLSFGKKIIAITKQVKAVIQPKTKESVIPLTKKPKNAQIATVNA